ncbi:MAG: isoprenyl transferase [Paludibacteraceae bacterium]|nr:isoprenyl transferase [Paludibacteraceae bacterium]
MTETLKEQVLSRPVPAHIAIIMDGNGRWAMEKGRPRTDGHREAQKAVDEALQGCLKLGVKFLTLYTFSTENWNRPKEEVDALMSLLVYAIEANTQKMMDNGVRLRVIGDIGRMNAEVRARLDDCIEKTSKNKGLTLILALSYSSRWELTEAFRAAVGEAKSGKVEEKDIDEGYITSHLNTREYPDPDLLIRTGGEKRISNFLLWQIAYTELYFSDQYWPDFRQDDLARAILDYQNRQRRFGLTEEQAEALQ